MTHLSAGVTVLPTTAPEKEEMIVKGRSSPERRDVAREVILIESLADVVAGRKMKLNFHVPSSGLGEAFRQVGEPETRIPITWAIANDQQSTWRDASCQSLQQDHLVVRGEVV